MYNAQQQEFRAPCKFIEKWEVRCPLLGRHGEAEEGQEDQD